MSDAPIPRCFACSEHGHDAIDCWRCAICDHSRASGSMYCLKHLIWLQKIDAQGFHCADHVQSMQKLMGYYRRFLIALCVIGIAEAVYAALILKGV